MVDTQQFLTTTQAARILSVSPDTVLKWVKAGKITARRTLGGHFRIPWEAVAELSGNGIQAVPVAVAQRSLPTPPYQYCWEFHSIDGELKPECNDCLTFKSRSKRCYELRGLPESLGCQRLRCAATCEECSFYEMVYGQIPNVLILGKSRDLVRQNGKDKSDTFEQPFSINYATNEYESSALIESFRPDFVVVDCAFGPKRTRNICSYLFNDSRIPVIRIILASRRKNLRDYCDKEVFGWIKKPFTFEQLRRCTEGVA